MFDLQDELNIEGPKLSHFKARWECPLGSSNWMFITAGPFIKCQTTGIQRQNDVIRISGQTITGWLLKVQLLDTLTNLMLIEARYSPKQPAAKTFHGVSKIAFSNSKMSHDYRRKTANYMPDTSGYIKIHKDIGKQS